MLPQVVSRNLPARHIDSRYPGVYKSGSTPYSAMILGAGPSLYWRMGTNGTTDQSGNGRNGTGQGSITIGGNASLIADADAATNFDGTDDHIISSYAPFTAGAILSVEMWAIRDTSVSQPAVWGAGAAAGGPRLYLENGGNGVTFTPNDNANSTTWNNAWPGDTILTHVVLVFNDTTNDAELFINSVSQGVQANAGAWNGQNFQVGSSQAAFNPFDGKIDEVAVYERALSAGEVLAHYNNGIA